MRESQDAHWFSTKVRLVCLIEPIGAVRYMDSVYVFCSADFQTAFKRALELGKSQRKLISMWTSRKWYMEAHRNRLPGHDHSGVFERCRSVFWSQLISLQEKPFPWTLPCTRSTRNPHRPSRTLINCLDIGSQRADKHTAQSNC